MSVDASAAYAKYLSDKSGGSPCDCDFHQGRWQAVSPPYFRTFLGSFPLKYAKEGELLQSGFCNHPSNNTTLTPSRAKGAYDRLVAKLAKDAPPGGSKCSVCNTTNEYAAPNQKDGSYICYGCRV